MHFQGRYFSLETVTKFVLDKEQIHNATHIQKLWHSKCIVCETKAVQRSNFVCCYVLFPCVAREEAEILWISPSFTTAYTHDFTFWTTYCKSIGTKMTETIQNKKRFACRWFLSTWMITATFPSPLGFVFYLKSMALWPHPNIFSFFFHVLLYFPRRDASKQTGKCV